MVTGASRGIGAAIAIALARQGCRVAVNFRTRPDRASAVVAAIRKAGGHALQIQADVADPSAVERLIELSTQAFGPIEVLVNNAGVAQRTHFSDLDLAAWRSTLDTNLSSSFLVTQRCLGPMLERRFGRVLMISSIAAVTGGGVGADYAASKAGQTALAAHLARRYVDRGLTFNALAPAAIETDMTDALGGRGQTPPMGRLGTVKEVAQLAVAMLGVGYLTGQTVHLNGGLFP